MEFKNLFQKTLAILFSTSVILSGFLIFFKTYPDNFLSNSADALLYGTLECFSCVKKPIDEFVREVQIAREAQDKIDSLNSEINRLRDQLVDYQNMKRENERLLDYFEFKRNNPDMKFVGANVTGRMIGDSKGNLFLDVGSRDGVSLNDTVITESGLVGRVSMVRPFSCNVKTIMSPDVQIGVLDPKTGNIGMISGTQELADENLTRIILLKYKDSVEVSDIVVTSGFSGIYPRNLKAGTVKSVDYDSANSYYYAIIESFCDLDEIKNVFVITNFAGKNMISS